MSNYNYTIIHKPGKLNLIPDVLSRAPIGFIQAFHASVSFIQKLQESLSAGEMGKCSLENGLYLSPDHKIAIPQNRLFDLLKIYHDDANHPGQNKLLSFIPQLYSSPNIRKNIVSYVRSCHVCQICKTRNYPTSGKLHPIPTPSKPFDVMSTDTIVMGSIAKKSKNKYIQVFIDHLTRYVWAFPTAKNTSDTVINCLKQIINSGQTPQVLISDNYKSYTSSKFKKFLSSHNVKSIQTTSYHPQSNGLVEKANHTIISAMRYLFVQFPKKTWSSLLPLSVQNYNKTPHSATKFSPQLLMYGIDTSPLPSNLSIDEIRNLAKQNSESFKTMLKSKYDKKHPEHTFNVNDYVLKHIPDNLPSNNKLTHEYSGPFKIQSFTSPVTVLLINENQPDTLLKAHVSQLRPYVIRSPLSAGE